MTAGNPVTATTTPRRFPDGWKLDAAAIIALAMMAVWFLHISWRKWPDPIADSGLQWYAFWQVGHGALLYHDVIWNYGPLSALFNAALFRVFGPGMMVLVTANLVIYAGIVSLAYLAFRKACGRLGAFAACAVFISVFSFSRLNSIANYNYATPYSHESTHGMLLLLATMFVAVRWSREASPPFAFLLGLCGGLAAVLKPEFMLAGGLVGIGTIALRMLQKQRIQGIEFECIAAGIAVPTLLLTAWFSLSEPIGAAFVDASRAWWMVLVDRSQSSTSQQQLFSGVDRPWSLAWIEIQSALFVIVAVAVIWAAGWFVNRKWSAMMRVVTATAAVALLWFLAPQGGWFNADMRETGGWFAIGFAFPGLVAVIFILLALRVRREIKSTGRADDGTVMVLALAIAAGAMMARMLLHARIHHLGFYQAALAGMLIAAFIISEIPRWTGNGMGRQLAVALGVLVIGLGCGSIAGKSRAVLADQTEPVGSGRDRFYATAWQIDPTGAFVNWLSETMGVLPPQTTVFVFPEGSMINYLSRRPSPAPAIRDEAETLARLHRAPPDYVIYVSRDFGDFGVKHLGGEGEMGHSIVKWVSENYTEEISRGGDPFDMQGRKGARILRRKKTVN